MVFTVALVNWKSKVEWHRARLVLGWGTAREVLRALSAAAIVIMAALPSVLTPTTKAMAWSDLYASWSVMGIPNRPYRDELTGALSTSEGKRHRAQLVLAGGPPGKSSGFCQLLPL